MPPLLFFGIYGATVAGYIAIGERLLTVPLALLARSISRVYIGEGAKLMQTTPSILSRMFWDLARRLFLIGIIPTLVVVVGGPYVFALALGQNWYEAGRYAQVLAIALLLQFMFVPVSSTLNLIQRQDLQLIWDVIYATLVNGAILVSWSLELEAYWCVVLYSGAMFLSYSLLPIFVHFGFRSVSENEKADSNTETGKTPDG